MPSQSLGGIAGHVLMAGLGHASDEVQELGKIQQPIGVHVQLLHHTVNDARIFLALPRVKKKITQKISWAFLDLPLQKWIS